MLTDLMGSEAIKFVRLIGLIHGLLKLSLSFDVDVVGVLVNIKARNNIFVEDLDWTLLGLGLYLGLPLWLINSFRSQLCFDWLQELCHINSKPVPVL